MPYTYSFPTYLISEVTSFRSSKPNISHRPGKMDANTGNKGRLAIIASTLNSAHIDLEMSGMEGNVPVESGASSQGETDAGQRGKAMSHFLFGTVYRLTTV